MSYSRELNDFNATQRLKDFWANQIESVQRLSHNSFRDAHLHALPLARIKKIMKLDECVRTQMISAEVPVMLAKACEIFIEELTLRAWVHTEENKRKTLQKNDIAMAVSSDEQYDFLIDIVPREFTKHRKQETPSAPAVRATDNNAESMPYVIQLGPVGSSQTTLNLAQPQTVGVVPSTVTIQGANDGNLNQQTQSVLQLITGPNGELQLVHPILTGATVALAGTADQQQQQQQQQQASLLHQVITSDGSTAYVPVQIANADSVQLLKAQMMGGRS